ncbi:tyrosine-type recombinase/integrase [Cohnella sp.]|uniref:site-specific integrase n=1 Tax=Cohnella sp. TaxID=1883426 RepID=UPI0037041683
MAKKRLPKGVRERNGKYHYRYDITDPETGKRKQKETRGFATPKEAEREGVKIQHELISGTFVEEKDIMYNDWVDKWVELYRNRSINPVKETTVRLRKRSLKKTKAYFGGLKLREITKKMYQDMLIGIKNEGKKRRTVALVHEACPQMFAKAVDLGLIKSNPTIGASVPAYPRTVEQLKNKVKVPKFLEKEELALLLKTAKEHGTPQEYTTLYLLAYSGLRIGELLALEKDDFNMSEKFIRVYKTLCGDGKITDIEINTPKTLSSEREVTFGESVKKVMEFHFFWKNQYRMSVINRYYRDKQNRDFAFVNCRRYPGYPENAWHIQTKMKKFLQIAKLSDSLTPHSLRHTHVSLLAEAGYPLEHIQERLGHENDRVTRAVYLHVTEKKRKEAPELFDQIMGSF